LAISPETVGLSIAPYKTSLDCLHWLLLNISILTLTAASAVDSLRRSSICWHYWQWRVCDTGASASSSGLGSRWANHLRMLIGSYSSHPVCVLVTVLRRLSVALHARRDDENYAQRVCAAALAQTNPHRHQIWPVHTIQHSSIAILP